MGRHVCAVTILVPSYAAGLACYIDRLGFALIENTDLGGGKRWVLVAPDRDSQTRLLLAQARGTTQRAAIGQQTGGRVGFFLQTDRFEADYERLRASGVIFEEAPRTEPYGCVAVFRDDFGNRWDLIQPSL